MCTVGLARTRVAGVLHANRATLAQELRDKTIERLCTGAYYYKTGVDRHPARAREVCGNRLAKAGHAPCGRCAVEHVVGLVGKHVTQRSFPEPGRSGRGNVGPAREVIRHATCGAFIFPPRLCGVRRGSNHGHRRSRIGQRGQACCIVAAT